MNGLQQLINQFCPNGVEWKTLGEVCEILDSKRKPVSKSKRVSGQYPYYGANGVQDYVDNYLFDGTYLLVGEDGSVINPDKSPVVNWASGKIWVNNHAHILAEKSDVALLRFIFYSLQCVDVSDIVRGVPPKINQENLKGIPIPLPPLAIQSRIVEILDHFTNLTANLTAELALRRKQFEHFREKLLSLDGVEGVEWTKLGEIGKVCMCKRIMKYQTTENGDIPFYKIGTFGKTPDAYISKELFEEYKTKYSFPHKGDILISAAGTIGKTVVYDGEPAYFQDSNIVWLANNEKIVLNTYLAYCYQMSPWKVLGGGIIARLYNENIANAEIPVPPLAVQQTIVEQLDKFTALIQNIENELALRQKQYEYYREQLLSFPQPARNS